MEEVKPDIYLVEDEQDLLESLRLIFRMEGYRVFPMGSGIGAYEALSRLAEGSLYVLISDILMPGMSGVDLIRYSKARFPYCPAVAVTGHGDKPMVMELLRCGCDDFLDKPFAPDELLRVVEKVLLLQRKRDLETLVRLKAVETIQKEFQPLVESYAGGGGEKKVEREGEVAKDGEEEWQEGQEGIRFMWWGVEARVRPGGDWVGSRSERLREKFEEFLTGGVTRIELELGEVQDMDSLALGVLCSLSHELQISGGELVMREVAPSVRGLFRHVGLEKEFTILS